MLKENNISIIKFIKPAWNASVCYTEILSCTCDHSTDSGKQYTVWFKGF